MKENPTSLYLLSQFQGFLESCRPAVWVAPLYLWQLEVLNQASCDELWVVSGHGSPRPPSSTRASVVDDQHQGGKWESNVRPSDQNDDQLGGLQIGLGCHLRQPLNQRTLAKAGEEPPYRCLGTKGDLFSGTNSPEKIVESIDETPPRQYNSSFLYQQPRRFSLTECHVTDTQTV